MHMCKQVHVHMKLHTRARSSSLAESQMQQLLIRPALCAGIKFANKHAYSQLHTCARSSSLAESEKQRLLIRPALRTGIADANKHAYSLLHTHARSSSLAESQKQRLLIGPALRTGILDDIIPIAKCAVDRLTIKLESKRGTGEVVDLVRVCLWVGGYAKHIIYGNRGIGEVVISCMCVCVWFVYGEGNDKDELRIDRFPHSIGK